MVFPAGILQPPFYASDADARDELRRHRLGRRPRAHARVRRRGPAVRRRRQPARLVVAARWAPSSTSARRCVEKQFDDYVAARRRAHEGQAHARREHRGPRRPQARRTPTFERAREGAPGDAAQRRRLHARAAVLPRLRAGLVRQLPARRRCACCVATNPHSPRQFRVDGPLVEPAGVRAGLPVQGRRQDGALAATSAASSGEPRASCRRARSGPPAPRPRPRPCYQQRP